MFNWSLFGLLIAICIPGLIISIPRLIEALQTTIQANLRPGQKLPSQTVLVGVSIMQNLVIIAVASAIGTVLAPRIGLHAPFFEAFVAGKPVWPPLEPQLIPTLVVGIGGALLFVVVYYGVVRSRLDARTLKISEYLRQRLGIWGRLLYGGIVEEVLTRWGLMSLLIWVGVSLFGDTTSSIVWTAIVITGILFGLGHLPSHLAMGCQKTPLFIGAVIGLNLWASLLFGWLFWQYGLLAAMLAHMLFHLVWLPFEIQHVQVRHQEVVGDSRFPQHMK